MPVELMINGRSSGDVASRLIDCDMDLNTLRTYRGDDGRSYMDRFVGNDENDEPQYEAVRVNNDSALPWEAWRLIDDNVVQAARAQPRLYGDFSAAGMTVSIDAMAITMVTYQKRLGQAHARIGMDPSVTTDRDRSLSSIGNTPIPFIYSDWQYPIRDLRIAARGGMSLDLEEVREATRVVLETVDDILLGDSATPFDYRGVEMPGILNFGDALPKVITQPGTGGWTPDVTYYEVNDMLQLLIDNNYDGPWMLYFGSSWSKWLNRKFTPAFPTGTLRTEILGLEGVSGIRVLRRFTNDYRIIAIQMTQNVFRIYNGLPLRAFQWNSLDGWNVYGKVITSVAPQPRSDALGQTGIAIGSPP